MTKCKIICKERKIPEKKCLSTVLRRFCVSNSRTFWTKHAYLRKVALSLIETYCQRKKEWTGLNTVLFFVLSKFVSSIDVTAQHQWKYEGFLLCLFFTVVYMHILIFRLGNYALMTIPVAETMLLLIAIYLDTCICCLGFQ